MLVIGGYFVSKFGPQGGVVENYENGTLLANYPVLQDVKDFPGIPASWSQKIISSSPLGWPIPGKSVLLKTEDYKTFYCGEQKAVTSVYKSYNNPRSVGGWFSLSIIDCGNYYFVFDYGDAGPHMFGSFDKKSKATADIKKNNFSLFSSGFSLSLPYDSTMNNKKIILNGSEYALFTGAPIGLCPGGSEGRGDFSNDQTNCTYTDSIELLPTISTLRIWQDARGIFALNPSSIKIDSHYMDFFVVVKERPTHIFTDSEVIMWKDLFKSIKFTTLP